MSPFVCVMFVTNFLKSHFKKGVKNREGKYVALFYYSW